MRRVALIYNPASGQHSVRRRQRIAEALTLLGRAGIEVEALETYAAGSAGTLAQEAAGRGCDTVLACGGDGTVHEILQCLAGTPVALGVMPLGTANALAADLGLGNGFGASPVNVVERLLTATPVEIPVGRIFYRDTEGAECSRYFTVAAGIGADALFLSRLDARLKRRLGYLLYVYEALRVWVTHSFPLFQAEIRTQENPEGKIENVSQLLAIRIRDFGGALRNLAPGAALSKQNLSLLAFKTRSRLDYLRFFLAVLFRRQTFAHRIELLDAVSVDCQPRKGSKARIFVEADGELLGTLPARIEMASQTVTLLIPTPAKH